jgi:hypothetical protein
MKAVNNITPIPSTFFPASSEVTSVGIDMTVQTNSHTSESDAAQDAVRRGPSSVIEFEVTLADM